jgi:hypothetical protein
MDKTDKQTLLVISIAVALFIGLFIFAVKTYDNTPKFIEKVRVDSISVELRYPNLPDKVINYHTKRGVFTSIRPIYSIGDSIEVQIIKIKK